MEQTTAQLQKNYFLSVGRKEGPQGASSNMPKFIAVNGKTREWRHFHWCFYCAYARRVNILYWPFSSWPRKCPGLTCSDGERIDIDSAIEYGV